MATGNKHHGPRPGGIGEYFLPYGPVIVNETCTCGHCQKIIDVVYRAGVKELPAVCYNCQNFICPMCESKDECTPFERVCEIEERADVVAAVAAAKGGDRHEQHLRFLVERERGRTQFFIDVGKVTK